MNKAIMISIKPQHLVNILNGKKTIEVRKNKALANATKKLIQEYSYATIYVYCCYGFTLSKGTRENELTEDGHLIINKPPKLNGKVVCSFKCYKVEEIKPKVKLGILNTYNTYETETLVINPLLEKCCLSYEELDLYLEWKNGYAIHISDIIIFDTPKELSEFDRCVLSEDLSHDNIVHIHQRYRITKAPQNMVYVKVSNDN